jgi:hypothetical protein
LGLQPWEGGPTLVLLDDEPVYPSDTSGGIWERRDGPALYAALCKAAGVSARSTSGFGSNRRAVLF